MVESIASRLGHSRAHRETCFAFLLKNDNKSETQWLWIWRGATVLCILALILVIILVAVSLALLSKDDSISVGESEDAILSTNVGVKEKNHTPSSMGLFVERNEWIAQPPNAPYRNLSEVPVPYVIISHTATEPCEVRSECVLSVREIQNFHIESYGWSDIGYNFLVGGDGRAYVGRGWDAEGAHAKRWNRKSIGISFIGTFSVVAPDKEQLIAASTLIEVGVELAKISANYTLLGHRQVSNTTSPGQMLFDIIKTWDHWKPTMDAGFR